MKSRVHCFIDGFNLWHAIKDLKEPHLEWVNYRKLCEEFIDFNTQDLGKVFYFSAYPTWIPETYTRHIAFVKAIHHYDVTTIMGRFKKKSKKCPHCHTPIVAREEKETDVNIAVSMIKGAVKDEYDEAYLFSSDSDLTPALRFIANEYPNKRITLIAGPLRRHSKEMANVIGDKRLKYINKNHLVNCLMPAEITTSDGKIIAKRPQIYSL